MTSEQRFDRFFAEATAYPPSSFTGYVMLHTGARLLDGRPTLEMLELDRQRRIVGERHSAKLHRVVCMRGDR